MKDHDRNKESIGIRILAGLLSIPVFEIAMLFLGGGLYRHRAFQLLPLWFHIVYCLLAASIGVLFGFRGLAWLMGHLFFTHWGEEKNIFITITLWGVLVVATSVMHRFLN